MKKMGKMYGKKVWLPTAGLLTGTVVYLVLYSVSNKAAYHFVHITLDLFKDNIFLLKIPM